MARGRAGPHGATHVIRVDGHLDAHWSSRLGGLSITHEDDGTTTLHGPVTDQAALHGLLGQLRDLGVTLLSLETLNRPGERRGRWVTVGCGDVADRVRALDERDLDRPRDRAPVVGRERQE